MCRLPYRLPLVDMRPQARRAATNGALRRGIQAQMIPVLSSTVVHWFPALHVKLVSFGLEYRPIAMRRMTEQKMTLTR